MRLPLYIKDLRKAGKRSFSIQELMHRFGISHNCAKVALHRCMKTGDLLSPARGLYVIVPPEHQPQGCLPPQELIPLVMNYVGANYYVGLLSAGLFYGASHQRPARFQVISDRRMKHPSIFGDVEITYIYKKSVLGLPTQDFTVPTGYLKVATPELLALDLLEYPNHAGGLNHTATVFSELIEKIDFMKLIHLAKAIGVEYQLQRIGYILDHIDSVDEKKAKCMLNALAYHVQKNKKNYLPLAPEIQKIGYPRCKKWRIIENADIESDV